MEKTIPCPLPGWEIVREIGKGGYGKVYEIKKIDDFGTTEHSALKVISIPESGSEIKAYRDDGYDDESITTLLKNRVKDISAEFQLMSGLRGQTNIVSYEDHKTVPHQDDPGYDILIRMEFLTPLTDFFKRNLDAGKMDAGTVIQLGIDICKALELCRKKNIIHRDIKPQNIFINDYGNFKLGDFGIARTLDHSTHATKAGTYGYMAPEVYRAEKYNASVDIYSLGLVMYWMLNERRGPFLPLPPEVPKPSQNREALDRRMDGEDLPRPFHDSPALTDIVLKACAFAPEDRFSSPTEMRLALENLDVTAVVPEAGALVPEDRPSGLADTQAGTVDTDDTDDVFHPPAVVPEDRSSSPADAEDFSVTAPIFHPPAVAPEDRSSSPADVQAGPEDPDKTIKEPVQEEPAPEDPALEETISEKPVSTPGGSDEKTPNKKKPFLFAGIAVAAVAVVALIIGLITASDGKPTVDSLPEDEPSISVPAETLEPSTSLEPGESGEPREPGPWSDSFPVDAYLNGDWIETLKQYRSAKLEVVHEEKTDGSLLISAEKRLVRDWTNWQDTAPKSSDLVEVITRTTYYYRKSQAVEVSNQYNTATRTEYRWGDWMTSSTPVQADSSTEVYTSTQYRYRVYEYDYCYAVDWSEFAEDIIAPDDQRIVNVNTLFRVAAAESGQNVSMDNFLSDTNVESVYADVSSDQWYYDSISAVTGLGIMNTDEFLHFFPEQSVKVGDLVRAAVAVNRIYNGECGVLPEDADLYDLIENDAIARGIIQAGEFHNMEANVTRQQAATILFRVLPIEELTAINEITDITDMDNGSDAYRAVYQLARAGIVTFSEPSEAFFPRDEITRAEIASMLDRLMHPDKRYVR